MNQYSQNCTVSSKILESRKLAQSICIVLGLMATSANALTITHGDSVTGNSSANLVINGSFEAGNAGTNLGWTPGTHIGGYPGSEVAAIPGWASSYPDGAYGWWGPLGFAGAAPADGLNAVYFGNYFNTVGAASSIAANGVITFTGTPSFAERPGPVMLSQTISGLSTTDTYHLDFWTSGESNTSGFTGTGLFGLDITGEGTTYLMLPSSSNSFGASERYYVDFIPSASTITISFLNWGHITDISGTGSELVLDDVILSAVPEPSSLLLFITGLAGLLGYGAIKRKNV